MDYHEGMLRMDESGQLRLYVMYAQRLRTALTGVEQHRRYIMRERDFAVDAGGPAEGIRLDGQPALLASTRARAGGRLRLGYDLHLLLRNAGSGLSVG